MRAAEVIAIDKTVVVAALLSIFILSCRAVPLPTQPPELDRDGDGYARRATGSGSPPDYDDENAEVFRWVRGGIDQDRDGYIATASPKLSCVGAAWYFEGNPPPDTPRISYSMATGHYQWLGLPDMLGIRDRDDTNYFVH